MNGSENSPARERWLPWPASAFRARIRRMAAVGEMTREELILGRREIEQVRQETAAARRELAEQDARLRRVEAQQQDVLDGVRAAVDDEPEQRRRLWELRRSADYDAPYEEAEPLVSIVIPTYRNFEALAEVALPSALAQTHERIEVIVVGDSAPDGARAAVEATGDPRVRFHNLGYRGPYPDDPERRWMVAGVPPFNEAVRRAEGRWIAPLDDDDAFTPDHVERLLEHARATRDELVYGAIRQHRPGGASERLGMFPPRYTQFNIQACMYHAGLAEIFELELSDAAFGIEYDWSLMRRMMRAGVRISMVDAEVVEYFPSRFWGAPEVAAEPSPDRPPPTVTATPEREWELAPDGWRTPIESGGWDVAAVAESYRRKWPEFIRTIEGSGALGVTHEVPTGMPMGRDDPISQNIVLAYAHALATAASGKDSLSILDWGGATGHYYELGRRLVEGVELDYHVRELPEVAAVGRELSPDVHFHDDDTCLEGTYDLVVASGSIQYEEDWTGRLDRLAGAAAPWLFLSRVPVTDAFASFVALQRAGAYGYETEYLGWVLHRGELIEAANDAGLGLAREYALVGPMPVEGAPDSPRHIGLLLRRRESPGGDSNP